MKITGFTPYRETVIEALNKGYEGSLGDVANVIWHTWKQGRSILVCGSEGGATTAIHFADDLQSLGIRAHAPLSPLKLTQIANDDGYGWSLNSQLVFHRGFIVIMFSCSGTSGNVDLVRRHNDSILFTSTMNDLNCYSFKESGHADIVVKVRSDDHEIIEDIHLMMCHALKKMLKFRIVGEVPVTPKELEAHDDYSR